MIETQYDQQNQVFQHTGVGTVTVSDLLRAVRACDKPHLRGLWDFSQSQFDVPLMVLSSPTFPPVRQAINEQWAMNRIAFVVSAHLHKRMIQTLAEEGRFAFAWEVFFDRQQAQDWLDEPVAVH